ncbi:MAG: efflux RND transporter periplasmic adaptor subunit [Chloroflexi bacterium]|nr:efflux RND transporter periplasmic adaptor subunit [Chloroflexota bacterium]
MKQFFTKLSRRTWIIIGVAAAIVVAVIFINSRAGNNTAAVYQTTSATRGNLVAIIGATGTVRAKQTAVMTWQTTGTVESVNVKVGDSVPADFVMAGLAKTSLSQNIIMAEADLASAKTNLENLLNSNVNLAQAEQTLASANQAVEDAQKKVDSLDFRRASDDLISQTEDEITLAKRQVSRAEDAYNNVKHLKDGDPLKAQLELNLINARFSLNQKIATLEWYLGKPSELDAAQYRAALSVALAQQIDAQREYDRLNSGNVIEIASAQARVDAAQATLNMAIIKAPFPGIVTESYPLPGDQVGGGTKAFRLDNLSSLYVDVEVSEVDINSVAVGQTTTLSFDAILDKDYHGKVVEVANVGNTVAGVVNFTVTVELTDADEYVKPGMTAAVSVVVQEVKDVILIPNRAVRLVNEERVVYVLVNGRPVEVKVTLGASSDTMSVLTGGDLKEGDLIILNPPSIMMGGPFGG